MACADCNDEPNDAQTKRRDDMEAPFLGFVRVTGGRDIRILEWFYPESRTGTHCERNAATIAVKRKGGAHNINDIVGL